MAETEVESILREIRERVLSEQRAGTDVIANHPAIGNRGNGAAESESLQQVTHDGNENLIAENLSLIESYLTTTARAWDRVPPLVSNRSGLIARIELWLKRQLKRLTHWYTWEQVNFNAAVHHALRDLLPVLTAHEHKLEKLRAELAGAETRLEQYQTELTAQHNELSAEIDSQRQATQAEQSQMAARLAELVSELREGNQRLQDEQRVCFKQLALETSEAAVLEDRARRKTEALLEDLQRRVEQIEKGRKMMSNE
jgi:DNA repair exonuclease SbcCD ATPase subunit